jgi:diguanylate cyclase (GGDEF)-like protein
MEDYIVAEQHENSRVCLLLIDIDYFKSVNDTYGHDVGDKVLRKVASTIQNNVGTDSVAGRWGGEEFMIAIKGKSLTEALALAEKIRNDVSSQDYSPVKRVTISIGLIEARSDESVTDVYKRVDHALYNAKETGRDRVSTVYSNVEL